MFASKNPLSRAAVLTFIAALALSAAVRQLGSPRASDILGLAGIAVSMILAVAALIKGPPRLGAGILLTLALALLGIVALPNYLHARQWARRHVVCHPIAPKLLELSERTDKLALELSKSSNPTQAKERLSQHVSYLEAWAREMQTQLADAPKESAAKAKEVTDAVASLAAAYGRVSDALETRDPTFLDLAQRSADEAQRSMSTALAAMRVFCGS
ncbi:MAG: hypothetical protein HY791_34045 [Deltaproteobacteria bacterium]|nr:hypothetical protein [Deltaproteobacteria bacterium]